MSIMASGERAPVEFVMRDERQERRRAQNRKAQRTLRSMPDLLLFETAG